MHRSTTRQIGDRAAMGFSRAVIDTINDSPFLQQLGIKITGGEQSTDVEHAHPFGFTAYPMSSSDGSDGGMKGAAEAFLLSAAGNRSHPIAMPAIDRRFRPNGLQAGETVFHDAFKQFLHFAKEVARLESPKSFNLRVAQPQQSQDQSSGTGQSGQGQQGGQRQNQGARIADQKTANVDIVGKSDGTLAITAQGAATITAASLTINAGGCTITMANGKIVLDGEVHLGGSDGKRIGIIGTLDTKGDSLVEAGAANKVYAT